MCNLDIIAGPLTDEQLFNRWFFNSLEDADFVVTFVVFGAVFVMAVSVLALFAVMLTKHFKVKVPKPAAEPDGTVHFIPFICSIIGTLLVFAGIVCLIAICFNTNPWLYRYLPYDVVPPYALVTAALFVIALVFSPRAGKAYKVWNRICLAVCCVLLLICLYVYVFKLFFFI